jgi:hypothetical protein
VLAAALFLPLALRAAAGPLDYDAKVRFQSETREVSRANGRIEYEVTFPSVLKSPFAPNNTVWAHFSVPASAKDAPCIVILPVMAAPNIWIERRFINRFERDGFAVLWLEMPYQFHRRVDPSQPSGQVFLGRTAKRLAFNFRQSVLDARRALAWVKARPEVDPKRLGLFGISLGGMVGSAAYSVDPAPKHAVFLLAGADFPDLVVHSAMTAPFLKKSRIDPADIKKEWVGIDPLDYKDRNAGKTPLLVNASWDHVIPKANALKLHEAFPSSRQVWVPLGHYSAILHLLWMPGYISREFQRALRP